jgi:hypothetical protein
MFIFMEDISLLRSRSLPPGFINANRLLQAERTRCPHENNSHHTVWDHRRWGVDHWRADALCDYLALARGEQRTQPRVAPQLGQVSSTQRTQALLREHGFAVANCEHKVPCTPAGYRGRLVTQDLFGLFDTLAVHPKAFRGTLSNSFERFIVIEVVVSYAV